MVESISKYFIEYLIKLSEAQDRGALAALRRGLGQRPGEAPEMFPYIVPFLPSPASYQLENAFYLTGSLFALHPVNTAQGNMGNHLAACVTGENDREAIERRFVALLNSHIDDVGGPLRQTISYLKSREQPVNYSQLLDDLIHWSHPVCYVQRNWAAGFWARRVEANPEKNSIPSVYENQPTSKEN